VLITKRQLKIAKKILLTIVLPCFDGLCLWPGCDSGFHLGILNRF